MAAQHKDGGAQGQHNGGGSVLLAVLVVPRASRSEIAGWQEERLKVRLKAPPVDGEANAELLRTLAKLLGLPKGALSLQGGLTSRRKTVRIDGMAEAALRAKLPPQG